jgi:arylsulfatase A-like enzyme
VGESNWDRGKIPAYQALAHEQDAAYYVAQYDGEIRFLDHHIGRLLDGMEKLGLSDKTLTVFTSDHGESLGENNIYFMHGVSARAPEANVPLIFVYPPVFSPGGVMNIPVEAVDIAPTILALFGLSHGDMEGGSLLPLLEKKREKDLYYIQSGSGGWERAFVFYPWKVIINYKEGQTFLFNLEEDPAEENNLAVTDRETLEGLLNRIPSRFEKKDSDVKMPEIDKKILDDLKALGYLE